MSNNNKLNDFELNISLKSEDIAIIINVLQESIETTTKNIDLQDKKLINTGIPTKILKEILKNKLRAFNNLITQTQ